MRRTSANFKPVIKTYIDGNTTGTDLPGLAFGTYTASTKTVAYTFTPIAQAASAQSVVIGAKLGSATEAKAPAFTIAAQGNGGNVAAEIDSVGATNGTISIVLVAEPTDAPTSENFTPVIKAYIDSDTTGSPVTPTWVSYTAGTKTVA
jgi:hypothetical protein